MTKNIFIITMLILFLNACASPKVVNVRKINDDKLTCKQIKEEIAEADRFEDKARSEKGVTATNAAAVLFFWPALIATYDNVGDAIEAAKDRKDHLYRLSEEKEC